MNNNERRNTPRQEVAIPTIIMDQNLNKLTVGFISDLSRTGCRITSAQVCAFHDDLYGEVPGLTKPIKAWIVLRKDNMAHLEFACKSMVDVYVI